MYDDFFPERLSKLRAKKGVSARDMSLSLGQSENYINMIENKKAFPSMSQFFNICDYLKITPQEFFESGNDNPEKLNGVIADLKKLDDKTLSHVAEIVKGLAGK
jgi:transcriptional regulator with XRE-family HTH domain